MALGLRAGLYSAQNLYSFSSALSDPQCCLSDSVTPPLGQFLKKFPYLGHPVLGSTLSTCSGRRVRLASQETSGLPPNEYGNSEERVKKTQVKKALFCRDLAFCKGDSRWPSSQERCGSIRFLARLARKAGQEGGGCEKLTGLEVEPANSARQQPGSTPLLPEAQRDDITQTEGSSLEGLHQHQREAGTCRAEGLPEQTHHNSLLFSWIISDFMGLCSGVLEMAPGYPSLGQFPPPRLIHGNRPKHSSPPCQVLLSLASKLLFHFSEIPRRRIRSRILTMQHLATEKAGVPLPAGPCPLPHPKLYWVLVLPACKAYAWLVAWCLLFIRLFLLNFCFFLAHLAPWYLSFTHTVAALDTTS